MVTRSMDEKARCYFFLKISYVNGLPRSDIAIPATTEGDKFKTNTDFSRISVGKLHDYGTTIFFFKVKSGV